MWRPFLQVDVFGEVPYTGNPLAVILNSRELTTEDMQQFTRWTNLSECTFLLPPSSEAADYRVRIFTLAGELPFAGHPTLGSCHAWLTAGGQPKNPGMIVQECGAGLIKVRQGRDQLAFAAPPLLRFGPVDEAFTQELARVLGIDRSEMIACQWIDNGPGWVGVLLKNAAAVLAVNADFTRQTGREILNIGLAGTHPAGSPFAYEVRGLFSDQAGALREDPVTGSLNASLAKWLIGAGYVEAPYTASQGTRLGRKGRIQITQDDDTTIWVGGTTTTRVRGEVDI